MRFLLVLALSVALGAQRSCSLTQYAEDDATIIVSTVHPCHLIGDADLYGRGTRYAFYISFGTCLIGILFGLYDELKSPRLSFNVLFVALLIIITRNIHHGSFAIFEWYVVTGLAFVSGLLSVLGFLLLYLAASEDDEDTHGQKNEGGYYDKSNAQLMMAGAGDPSQDQDAPYPTIGEEGDHTGLGGEHNTGHERLRVGKEEVDSEETRIEKRARRWAKESRRPMLSGAISLGFSYLIFSVFFLMQPWLYFTQANTGHKQGCPVPVVFFGTFDM